MRVSCRIGEEPSGARVLPAVKAATAEFFGGFLSLFDKGGGGKQEKEKNKENVARERLSGLFPILTALADIVAFLSYYYYYDYYYSFVLPRPAQVEQQPAGIHISPFSLFFFVFFFHLLSFAAEWGEGVLH